MVGVYFGRNGAETCDIHKFGKMMFAGVHEIAVFVTVAVHNLTVQVVEWEPDYVDYGISIISPPCASVEEANAIALLWAKGYGVIMVKEEVS